MAETSKAIRDQIKELEEKAQELEKAETEEYNRFFIDNSATLLTLVPNHSRTSCSDDNRCNTRRCERCALLYVDTFGEVPEDMHLAFWVTVSRKNT